MSQYWLDADDQRVHVAADCEHARPPLSEIDASEPEWGHWWRREASGEATCCDTRETAKCMSRALSERVCECWGSPVA